MYKLNPSKQLTPSLLKKIIENNASEYARLLKLGNYYIGKQDILNRYLEDITKPCNKTVVNYASYISDLYTGYFMGEQVKYTAPDELQLKIDEIFNYNDEAEENITLASDASIYGIGFELLYTDADGQARFKRLDAKEVILIFDDTLEENLLYAIRYYYSQELDEEQPTLYVELYSATEIVYMSGDELTEYNRIPHIFKQVPVAFYYNNKNKLGDFEPILTLQDQLNKLESFSLDEAEYFADCYLMLSGMQGTEAEDIIQMKSNRVLLLPENGTAQFLVKQIDTEATEAQKKRIVDSIHKISKCPPMTDETFGTQSGIALRYKLIAFESSTSLKERYFKKGLQRRLELIMNYLGVLGSTYDYRDIDIVFSRALPTSENEIAELIANLSGTVSKETLISLLPFIDNPAEEIAKVSKENELQPKLVFGEPNAEPDILS